MKSLATLIIYIIATCFFPITRGELAMNYGDLYIINLNQKWYIGKFEKYIEASEVIYFYDSKGNRVGKPKKRHNFVDSAPVLNDEIMGVFMLNPIPGDTKDMAVSNYESSDNDNIIWIPSFIVKFSAIHSFERNNP